MIPTIDIKAPLTSNVFNELPTVNEKKYDDVVSTVDTSKINIIEPEVYIIDDDFLYVRRDGEENRLIVYSPPHP